MNNSVRQIRPGDRVKTANKKYFIGQQSSSSLNTSNLHHQSTETRKEHEHNQTMTTELMTNKHVSSTTMSKNKYR